jgi:hypothetical protein
MAKVRTASDLPERFVLPAANPGGGCLSPITDPRTGRQYRFVRADKGVADYELPDSTYGASRGELLRLDCRTGQANGLVRR